MCDYDVQFEELHKFSKYIFEISFSNFGNGRLFLIFFKQNLQKIECNKMSNMNPAPGFKLKTTRLLSPSLNN